RELTDGAFREAIPDPLSPHPSTVTRLLLCQGKTYWELARAREERGIGGVAIVRVEQLYPFPLQELREVLEHFADAEPAWVQEEPANMGAWWFVRLQAEDRLGVKLAGVTRTEG